MKKIFALIITAALVFSLCACTGLETVELPPLPTVTPEAAAEATPAETAAPVETETEIDAPPAIVSIKRTEKKEYDPQNGTTLILTFSYDTPTVYIEGNSEAAAGINEYASLLDESYYTGENYGDGQGTGYSNMLTMAEDNYNYLVNSGITDGMYELVSSRTVTVERLDVQVLTLLYNDYSFTGGAHGFFGDRAYCFNAEDGALLTLESLSPDPAKLQSFLLDFIVQTATNDMSILERIDQTLLVDGDLSKTLETILRDGSWYFSRDGLVVFSDLYEISSYAAGPIKFTVPYDKLMGVIDDKWLPAELSESCEFKAIGAGDMEDGSTVILDKLTIDEGGEELFLISSGTATDVKLSLVDYTDNVFYETAELWNCSEMKDCALQMVTMIPDGMPNVKLSYSDKDGRHELLLTQSGEDGSFILTDDSIEAVG